MSLFCFCKQPIFGKISPDHAIMIRDEGLTLFAKYAILRKKLLTLRRSHGAADNILRYRRKGKGFLFMKKRFLGLFMAVVTTELIGLASVSTAYAAENLVYGDFSYEIKGNSVTITKYNGDDSFVYIPDQIDGRDVTVIGKDAFKHNEALENIRLPNKLEYIGVCAFYGCDNLVSVTLPNSLKSLHYDPDHNSNGSCQFEYCHSLQRVVMGKNISDIPDETFQFTNISIISLSEGLWSSYVYDDDALSDVYIRNPQAEISGSEEHTIYYPTEEQYNKACKKYEDGIAKYEEEGGYYAKDYIDGYTTYLENTVYTPLEESHAKVSFNGNGGMIPDTEGGMHETDDIWTLLGQPVSEEIRPEKQGCDFMGWYETPDCTGEPWDFVFNEVYGDMTLYAKFVPARHTVTLDAQGGSCDETEQLYSTGYATDSLPTPVKTDYQFIGWYTRPEGNGELYTTTSSMPNTDIKLYAAWLQKGKSLTVRYSANGGECSKTQSLVPYNSTISDLPTPTRSGSTFLGWNTKIDGSGEYYTKTTKVIRANLTLYAIWETESYKLTFDPGKGTVGTRSRNVEFNAYIGELPYAERDGYKFLGWAYKDGTYADPYDTMPEKDVTLTAMWGGYDYIILFDPRGGVVSTEIKTVSCGESIGTMPTPTRTGYKFAGWYTKTKGRGTEYTAKSKMPEKDITLYASWKKATDYATSISLAKTNLTLGKGEVYTLGYTTKPSETVDKLKWTSSNTKVVTVNQKGVLTAKGIGTATITVKTTKGKTDSVKVTVKKAATSIKMPYSTRELNVGQTISVNPKIAGATGSLKWSTSNASVATVSASGKITAKKQGTAVITATTFNGVSGTIYIRVG